jgi:hypothetical protein
MEQTSVLLLEIQMSAAKWFDGTQRGSRYGRLCSPLPYVRYHVYSALQQEFPHHLFARRATAFRDLPSDAVANRAKELNPNHRVPDFKNVPKKR